MFGLPPEHIIPIANFIGLGILGLVAYFGQRWGKNQPTPPEKAVQVAGALVDSESVRLLTAAIEGQAVESAEVRHQSRRATEGMLKLAISIDKNTDELSELRNELRQLGDAISRRR